MSASFRLLVTPTEYIPPIPKLAFIGLSFFGDAKQGRSPPPKRYTHLMSPRTTTRISLTALLGTPVTDAQGHLRGRLKDIAVATGEDAGKVAGLVLKTRAGLCIVPSHQVMETPAGTLELRSAGALVPLKEEGNYLYLQQDRSEEHTSELQSLRHLV